MSDPTSLERFYWQPIFLFQRKICIDVIRYHYCHNISLLFGVTILKNIPYIPERLSHVSPQIPMSKLGVRWSFQVQTVPRLQSFHQCVSRALPGCPIVLAGLVKLVVHNRCGTGYMGNSHLGFTPQAPLNHSGVCLCDFIMVGQVQVVRLGSPQGVARSGTPAGFSLTWDLNPPLRLRPKSPSGYLSGI